MSKLISVLCKQSEQEGKKVSVLFISVQVSLLYGSSWPNFRNMNLKGIDISRAAFYKLSLNLCSKCKPTL